MGGLRLSACCGWVGVESFDDGGSYTTHLKDHDASDTTFDRSVLSAFTHFGRLGLELTGQHVGPDETLLNRHVTDEDL